MFDQALDHVSLSVSDFEASRAFYEGLLGLEADAARPNFGVAGAWYKVGQSQIHVIEKPPEADLGSTSPNLVPLAAHLALRVDDYEKTVAFFRERDVEMVETNAKIGQLWIRDPDGNIIEFTAR